MQQKNAFYTCTKIEEINYGRLKQLINYVLFLNTKRQQLQKVVSVVVFAATLDYIINLHIYLLYRLLSIYSESATKTFVLTFVVKVQFF